MRLTTLHKAALWKGDVARDLSVPPSLISSCPRSPPPSPQREQKGRSLEG